MKPYRYCPHCASELVARDFDGRVRMACAVPDCGFVHWDSPLPVVAALVERKGLIVLARNRAWPEKMFGLVTGFLERDETPENAVAREVKEEIDLDVTRISLIGLYAFSRRNELLIAYHVEAEGELKLNEELAEVKLIAPERLQPWDFGTGFAVRDWLARRGAA